MKQTVVGVFDNHSAAEEAVRKLQRDGFDMRRLSIIGKGYHKDEQVVGFYTTGDRMKTWGGIGAFWGSVWGLLIGAAFVWIPGFGPLAVAGPLANLLVTALGGPQPADTEQERRRYAERYAQREYQKLFHPFEPM